MEIYYIVICCALFTTAASLSVDDAISDDADDSLVLHAKGKKCPCENGRCIKDKQGNMKCSCKPGFSLQDEFSCKPCDCGSLGQCIFALQLTDDDQPEYHKKCVCNEGSAEQDGVCVDCFCGEKSECDFEHGERRCYCIDGYAENDGVCTECDCGFFGKCYYENGEKKCECDEGYLDINGVCEECDCGSNTEKCEYVNGVKQCKCKEWYAERYGTCEECDCGPFSKNCSFKYNRKTCSCLDGYVQKGETCGLGCRLEQRCQNGGDCKGDFCYCLNGTRGRFCEVIDECPNLCPNQRDTKCSYGIASQKAYCRCLDSTLSYDPITMECKSKTCQTDYQCVNGECRNGVCECLRGTWGDRCENVDCVTDAIKCNLIYLFWKGTDTIQLLWKSRDTLYVLRKQKLLKFVRTDVVLKRVDDNSVQHVTCEDSRYEDILWGQRMVYVPTPDNKFLLYLIEDSTGARCSSSART